MKVYLRRGIVCEFLGYYKEVDEGCKYLFFIVGFLFVCGRVFFLV